MISINKLAPGHNFLLLLGPLKLSFSKITGIDNELSIEMIHEGGVNDRVIPLYTPKKTYGKLIFQHGIGDFNLMNQNFTMASFGHLLQLPGTIVSFSNNKIHRIYCFTQCAPVKWSISELDATNSSVIIDTIEVIHSGIQEYPNSF